MLQVDGKLTIYKGLSLGNFILEVLLHASACGLIRIFYVDERRRIKKKKKKK
jgi:hypothetical protein